jgi:hypothetical protein
MVILLCANLSVLRCNMSVVIKSRNKWVMTMVVSGTMSFVFGYMSMRRYGLGTDWARIQFLNVAGEYRTLIEAGAIPDNAYLPNHLRLDRTSYLDRPDTCIALPPLVDISQSPKQRVRDLKGAMPKVDRTDVSIQVPFVKVESVIMSRSADERYIKRRMGISDEEREKQRQLELKESAELYARSR